MEQLNNRNFYLWTPNLNSKNSGYLSENFRLELFEAPRLTIATSRRPHITRNTQERRINIQTFKVWRKKEIINSWKGSRRDYYTNSRFQYLKKCMMNRLEKIHADHGWSLKGLFHDCPVQFSSSRKRKNGFKDKKKVSQLGLYKASQI